MPEGRAWPESQDEIQEGCGQHRNETKGTSSFTAAGGGCRTKAFYGTREPCAENSAPPRCSAARQSRAAATGQRAQRWTFAPKQEEIQPSPAKTRRRRCWRARKFVGCYSIWEEAQEDHLEQREDSQWWWCCRTGCAWTKEAYVNDGRNGHEAEQDEDKETTTETWPKARQRSVLVNF